MTLEHAERDQLRAGEHLLEGVRHRVQDQRVEGPIGSERRHNHRAALVDAEGDVELLRHLPDRVVGAVAQGASEAGVGANEARHEPELGRGAAQLGGGRGGVLQRHHGRAEQAAPVLRAVVGQPVVVGPGQRHGAVRVGDGREIQPDGGVEHGLVDALGVHVGQAGCGVPPAGLGVGQRAERRRVVEGGSRSGQVAQGDGQDLGPADHDMLIASGVTRDTRSLVVGEPGPGRLGLDDVTVGVDDGTGPRGRWVRRGDRHGAAGVRQSSTGGSGWRNSTDALPPATARSSSSGSEPQVSVSTRWVSGHDESACG